jgi:hypothetical protein
VTAEVRSLGPDPVDPGREFSVVLRLSDRPAGAPEPGPDEVRLAGGGTVSVSNEEHYQTLLQAATGGREVASSPFPVVVDLVIADAGNPWVKSSTGPIVEVRLGGDTVGFLTKAMTERYRRFVDEAGREGKRLTTGAWLARGVRGGQAIVEISLDAVPRRADRDTIEGLDVEVTPELIVDGPRRIVHRLGGERPDGSHETLCGLTLRADAQNLIGTTKPWVGRVEMGSGRIYDGRLEHCERC